MKVGQVLLLLFFSTSVFSTNAWDVAVAVGGQIEFLNTTGAVVGQLSEGMADVAALAYNTNLRRMYFSDEKRPDGSIFQLTVPSEMGTHAEKVTVSTVVSKQVYGVKGVAFDDKTNILYWTNGPGRSILWIRVGSTDEPQAGQPLIKMSDEHTPMGIAIDNCKRFLYWTNCGKKGRIERSLLDGSDHKTLIQDNLNVPYAVVVDQTTDRIYWVDLRPGSKFRIESANLNGKDRRVLIDGSDHEPYALAVGGSQIFWADHIRSSVWRLPLDTPHSTTAKKPLLVAEYANSPQALAPAYSGVWIREDCNPVIEPYIKVIPATITKVATDPPITNSSNTTHPICFNEGLWMAEQENCDCLPRYTGAFCEVDECLLYCVEGECHFGANGRECVCRPGYKGARCEVSVCHNYCVTGTCSVNVTGDPQCHCKEGYSEDRCEVNFTQQQEAKDDLKEVCTAFCKLWTQSSKQIQPFDVCSCADVEASTSETASGWRRDHTLVALIALCSLLSLGVVLLAKKVLVLRKRPRVKKRIIVNKSVTPLTCRPNGDPQCEITIENCCNMNICETPCFEPDFRQPQATLTKPSSQDTKEEKKTLLGNMELPPDDLY